MTRGVPHSHTGKTNLWHCKGISLHAPPLPFAEVDSGHREAFVVVLIQLEQNTKVGAPVVIEEEDMNGGRGCVWKCPEGGAVSSRYDQDTLYTCMQLPRKKLTLFLRVGNGGQWVSALSLIFNMPRALCWWKPDWCLPPCEPSLWWIPLPPEAGVNGP